MKYHMLNSTASMTQDGELAGRILQNNTTPYIDIFVRESIQNCLDAGDEHCQLPYVTVDFIIDAFDKVAFNEELDEVSSILNEKTKDDQGVYIAIKDTNTTGLTGALKSTDIKNNQTGNFRSLVYNIGKRQRSKGAGGSWGIGKTSFYRLSKYGIVIYYTRIKLEGGTFQCRLSVAMIENSTKEGILKPDANGNKSGVAWWGAGVDSNREPYPVTDEYQIKSFLQLFKIPEFSEEEVGTIVIIPYIDKDALLKNAMTLNDESNTQIHTSWENDLAKSLEIAIQRWYSPRLDNPFYYREKLSDEERAYKYLTASVNGKRITCTEMSPIFKVIRDLYNTSLAKLLSKEVPIGISSATNIKTKVVEFNRINGNLGILSYVSIKKTLLVTSSESDPYLFVDIDHKNDNRMILCMTRRPGMIVQYNPSEWLRGLPESAPDECIIALFVLDQFAKLKNTQEPISLEEYIRDGGENADHLGWHDHPVDNDLQKQNCVGQIFSKCHDFLLDDFAEKIHSDRTNTVKGLSTLVGKILQIKPNKRGGGGHVPRSKTVIENGVTYTIKPDIQYSSNSMNFMVDASAKKFKKGAVSLCLNMDASVIDCNKWEKDTLLKAPFYIKQCAVFLSKFDGVNVSENISIDENQVGPSSYIKLTREFTSRDQKWYRIGIENIDTSLPHNLELSIMITISLISRDFRPNIKF